MMHAAPPAPGAEPKPSRYWWSSTGHDQSRHEVLDRYVHMLHGLNWSESKRLDSLDIAIHGVDAWAQEQVRYYDRVRRRRRWGSSAVRVITWLFASAGVVAPFVGSLIAGGTVAHYTAAGYVLLAIAAAFTVANALFGITKGHVRVASAQLALEQVIIETHIKWLSIIANGKDSNKISDYRFAQAIAVIQSYGRAIYAVVKSENAEWGQATVQELARFEAMFQRQNIENQHEMEQEQAQAQAQAQPKKNDRPKPDED